MDLLADGEATRELHGILARGVAGYLPGPVLVDPGEVRTAFIRDAANRVNVDGDAGNRGWYPDRRGLGGVGVSRAELGGDDAAAELVDVRGGTDPRGDGELARGGFRDDVRRFSRRLAVFVAEIVADPSSRRILFVVVHRLDPDRPRVLLHLVRTRARPRHDRQRQRDLSHGLPPVSQPARHHRDVHRIRREVSLGGGENQRAIERGVHAGGPHPAARNRGAVPAHGGDRDGNAPRARLRKELGGREVNDDVPLGLKAEPKGHGYPVVRVTAVDLLVGRRGSSRAC